MKLIQFPLFAGIALLTACTVGEQPMPGDVIVSKKDAIRVAISVGCEPSSMLGEWNAYFSKGVWSTYFVRQGDDWPLVAVDVMAKDGSHGSCAVPIG